MPLFIAYKIAWSGIRIAPRSICVWFGRRVADACFMFDGPARRAVIANLTHVLRCGGRDVESPEGRREIIRLARETFENFAIHIVDFMRVDQVRSDLKSGLLSIERLDRFEEEFRRGKGLISVTAHVGNWEMGAAATAAMGFPLHAVALRLPDGRVNAFFSDLRDRGGIRLIHYGQAARGCFRALRAKEMLALVSDRDLNGNGHPVSFFGRQATIPRGPAEIAARSGAPLVPAFCVQEADGRFRLYIEEPIRVDEGLPLERRIDVINNAMVGVIERYIARYPSQWFAFYRVWK
ncbi:MAG: lysophospholipid acyltransferase family protein [Candidatus Aureabacteria bacterium]|nr:lysophospholipid acyltransferase family protein [Candidatus Auribacterota bacterium]